MVHLLLLFKLLVLSIISDLTFVLASGVAVVVSSVTVAKTVASCCTAVIAAFTLSSVSEVRTAVVAVITMLSGTCEYTKATTAVSGNLLYVSLA